MSLIPERLEITIRIPDGELTSRSAAVVQTVTADDHLLRQQTTDVAALTTWLHRVQQQNTAVRGLDQVQWVDLLAASPPLIIGVRGTQQVILTVRTRLSWVDQAGGGRTLILPPTLIGGRWDIQQRSLQWSGVAVWPQVPTIFTPQMPIYAWPFGNVYEQGYVCWGSVSTQDLQHPSQFPALVDRFLGSAFNTDLRRSGWSVNQSDQTVQLATDQLPAYPLNVWCWGR